MKRKATIVLSLFIILLAGVAQVKANELQRLVFNAAGNIGMTEAIVEFQGITPANSAAINGYINTAITMLDQLAGQYNDPPFDSGQIRKIAGMLRRFPQATERMNNRGKASYLQNCYANLKSAMSIIFRSDFGLKYNSTCDTFVAELGYQGGLALAASQMGNSFLEGLAKSGINQALSAGARVRDTLGCSFLTADQARDLNVANLRTPEEFTQMVRSLENTVRLASLNMEPGFDSPATRGKVPPPVRIDPPPPPNPPVDANDLTGSWRDGLTVISREGGYYVARNLSTDVPSYYVGYRPGMVTLKFADQRDATGFFPGKHLYFRYRESPIWIDAAIEYSFKPATGQELLKIHYTYEGKKSWAAFSRYRR